MCDFLPWFFLIFLLGWEKKIVCFQDRFAFCLHFVSFQHILEIDQLKESFRYLSGNVTQDITELEEKQHKEINTARDEHKEDLETVKHILLNEHRALREIQVDLLLLLLW